MKTTGGYDLSTIKFFASTGAVIKFNCRACGAEFSVDAGDGLIEYPTAAYSLWWECDCGHEFETMLKIKMTVEVEVAQ